MPDEFLKWNETVAEKSATTAQRSESLVLGCVLSWLVTEVMSRKDLEIVVFGMLI